MRMCVCVNNNKTDKKNIIHLQSNRRLISSSI